MALKRTNGTVTLADRTHRAQTIHGTLAGAHPSLARGQVWCRTCGATQRVNSGHSLRHGWPKCCGCTMTIDSPDEQRPARRAGGRPWLND